MSNLSMVKFERSKKGKGRKDSRDSSPRSRDSSPRRDTRGGRSFEGGPRGRRFPGRDSQRNGRDRREITMTKATCSSCGNECELPFKPISSKPVYCSDCFAKKGKFGSDRISSKDLELINEKLDKIMNALKIN